MIDGKERIWEDEQRMREGQESILEGEERMREGKERMKEREERMREIEERQREGDERMNKGEERRDRKNVTEGVKGGKGRDRKREVRKSSLYLILILLQVSCTQKVLSHWFMKKIDVRNLFSSENISSKLYKRLRNV